MKIVKLYKLQPDGSQRVAAICRLQDERVVCEGDSALAHNLVTNGIPDVLADSGDRILLPKDGIKFLEGLKFAFKSGYLNASDVMDDEV